MFKKLKKNFTVIELKEKLERLSGKKVFLKELSPLPQNPVIMSEEVDVSGIMSRIVNHSSFYVQLLKKFVDFNPEKDTLIKAEYVRIKEALDRLVKYDFGIPLTDLAKNIAKRDGLTFNSPYEFGSNYGTKTENGTTILNMLLLKNKVSPKYVKMMNSLEKEIYDYINSPKPDSKLYEAVKKKLALMKTRIVQREPKAVSAAREREIIKGALNPHLREVIDKIAEEFRKVVEEDTFVYYMEIVKNFRKDFSGDIASPEQYRQKYYKTVDASKKWGKWIDGSLTETGLVQHTSTGGAQLKSNVESFAKQKAVDVSHITMKNFQNKMYDKLSGFLTELGKDFDVSYTGTLRVNDIHFKFADGSRFSIRNQIVRNYRYPGGFYYSYPTTFHDAYLANNVKINQPSEYTIKKAFTNS